MQKVLYWRIGSIDNNLREVLTGSIIGLVVKIAAALSLFIMNVTITNSLGAEQAGLFFLSFTLCIIIATLGRVGLDQAIVRFISKDSVESDSRHVNSIYNKALVTTFLSTSSVCAILYVNAHPINSVLFDLNGFEAVFKMMLIATPVMALFIVHAQALQGLKKIAKSMLIASVFLPIGVVLCILIKPTDVAADISMYVVISSLTTLLIAYFFWQKSTSDICHAESFSFSTMKATCMPLWVVAVVHQVVQWSSQLLLGVWEDASSVALFATAQRTAMLTSFVLFAVNSIVAPKFSAMHALSDFVGLKKVAIMSVRLMLAASLPIILFIITFPEFLMSLFGEEFKPAASALIILALGQFINIVTGSVGYLLSMTGNEKALRNNMLISGTISIGVGVLIIPIFGIVGAAFSYSLGVAAQNLLGVYQVKRALGFNTLVFWQRI